MDYDGYCCFLEAFKTRLAENEEGAIGTHHPAHLVCVIGGSAQELEHLLGVFGSVLGHQPPWRLWNRRQGRQKHRCGKRPHQKHVTPAPVDPEKHQARAVPAVVRRFSNNNIATTLQLQRLVLIPIFRRESTDLKVP